MKIILTEGKELFKSKITKYKVKIENTQSKDNINIQHLTLRSAVYMFPFPQMARSHYGASFQLVDLPPPSPLHIPSPMEVLSKMSRFGVLRSLSKGHVSHSIKFAYSSLHLANPTPHQLHCSICQLSSRSIVGPSFVPSSLIVFGFHRYSWLFITHLLCCTFTTFWLCPTLQHQLVCSQVSLFPNLPLMGSHESLPSNYKN